MKKIEILAPAGGFDSIISAVRSGADAVYVGEKSFSARASAQNFDKDELKKAIKEFKGTVLLVCHEPEFYMDIVDDVWNIEDFTTKIV